MVIDISYTQLLFCLIFVIIAGACSVLLKLDLEKDLAIGTVRAVAQLFLLGYALQIIFELNEMALIVLLFIGMIFFAAWTIKSRVKKQKVDYLIPTFISMLISYLPVTIIVTAVIIQVHPWYRPQYFIPLGGMVIGNSMNAIAVSLDRMFSDLNNLQDEIELNLCLGATSSEASSEILKNSIRAGMIPSINSLMAVGIVFIPGMMSGQILAGADPVTAIKYQIVVMLMLVASTAIGSIIVLSIVRNMFFTKNHQIKL